MDWRKLQKYSPPMTDAPALEHGLKSLARKRVRTAKELVDAHRRTLARERFHRDFGIHKTPFAICRRRASFPESHAFTEYDRVGNCHYCGVQVVFDAKASGGKLLFCVRCAYTLSTPQTDEMSGAPQDLTDEEYAKRLHENVRRNEREGPGR